MCIACKLTSEIKYKKNKNIYYLIKIKRKHTKQTCKTTWSLVYVQNKSEKYKRRQMDSTCMYLISITKKCYMI